MMPARTAIVIALACTSCGDVVVDDAPALPDRVQAAREHMHRNYAAATAAQHAIAIGDLDRARGEARRMASRDDPDVLPAWRPYLDDIRAAAQQVAASADTITAARTMARLGDACARCHDATNAKIVFPRELPPPRATMASHQWAAARMWEGVIGPSEERWRTGATTLAGALTMTAEGGELGVADDAARVKLFAKRGLGLSDRTARATLYGDLLATCAHCHAAIRDRTLPVRSAASN